MSTDLNTPWIAATLEELIAGATDRAEVRTSDARSGARFERMVTGSTSNWEFKAWQAGLYVETPSVIDHTVLGMALEAPAPPLGCRS